MSDVTRQLTRLAATAIWGLIAWALLHWWGVALPTKGLWAVAGVNGVTVAMGIGIRLAERKWAAVGHLLIAKGAPTYATPTTKK